MLIQTDCIILGSRIWVEIADKEIGYAGALRDRVVREITAAFEERTKFMLNESVPLKDQPLGAGE